MNHKKLAKKILEFWRNVELLNQSDYPDSRFCRAFGLSNLEVTVRNGGAVVYIGKAERYACVKEIAKYIQPDFETVNESKSGIAAAVLQIESDGRYTAGSFAFSPLVFVLSHLKTHSADKYIQKPSLPGIMKALNEYTISIDLRLKTLFDLSYPGIYSAWLKELRNLSTRILNLNTGLQIEETFAFTKTEKYPPKLLMDFYSKDLHLVEEYISNSKVQSLSRLLHYINSLYYNPKNRIDLLSDKNAKAARTLARTLTLAKGPIGKWPSSFSPALMQQFAINKTIAGPPRYSNKQFMFSVNGPPGTGKTTLVKEIVAEAVVQKALLLSSYTTPDDAFEAGEHEPTQNPSTSSETEQWFKIKDDRLNDWSIIVASDNNNAVENISKELPTYESIQLEAQEYSDVADCFDNFRRNNPWANGKQWDVISVPLGRKDNIEDFKRDVLQRFRNLPGEDNLYRQVRAEFLSQYNRVEQLKNLLSDFYKGVRKCLSAQKSGALEQTALSRLRRKIERKYHKSGLPEAYIRHLCNIKNCRCIAISGFYKSAVSNNAKAQTANPWATPEYDKERIKLFILSRKFLTAFALSSHCLRKNLDVLDQYWAGQEPIFKQLSNETNAYNRIIAELYRSLLLFIPVVSTTLASVGRMFRDVTEPKAFGIAVIDEAGQVQPHHAVGLLFRSRRALLVGDPFQIEPVVKDEFCLLKELFRDKMIKKYCDFDKNSSQTFADNLNKYGTLVKQNNTRPRWIGSPLLIHRRCISPMFDICNALSYAGIMKNETGGPSPEDESIFVLKESRWIQVSGKEFGSKNHAVPEQCDTAAGIVQKAFLSAAQSEPDIFVISPFTTVVDYLKQTISARYHINTGWMNSHIGTVHTFQGKQAKEVVFVLGCDTDTNKNVITFVSSNIVNVAVSRAKYRLYVIGDFAVWQNSQQLTFVYNELCKHYFQSAH